MRIIRYSSILISKLLQVTLIEIFNYLSNRLTPDSASRSETYIFGQITYQSRDKIPLFDDYKNYVQNKVEKEVHLEENLIDSTRVFLSLNIEARLIRFGYLYQLLDY